MKSVLFSTLASLSLLVACATPMSAPTQTSAGMLTNSAGMTLYTFDKDPANAGKSVCNDECAAKWPPLLAASSQKPAGAYTIIDRDDGTRQWAFKGKPLYLWFKDQKPGDASGDGVNNVWHTARP